MKKKSKIKKNISSKTDNNPANISTIQVDSTPNNVVSKQIIVGDQLGMPEEAQHRITFAYFRKKSREFKFLIVKNTRGIKQKFLLN